MARSTHSHTIPQPPHSLGRLPTAATSPQRGIPRNTFVVFLFTFKHSAVVVWLATKINIVACQKYVF